jgi:hypothetical protein
MKKILMAAIAASLLTVAIPSAHAITTEETLRIITPPSIVTTAKTMQGGMVKTSKLSGNSTTYYSSELDFPENLDNLSGQSFGTNLAILSIKMTNTAAGRVSTIIVTNIQPNHSYRLMFSTNLLTSFTDIQPLWLGVVSHNSHTQKFTNSSANTVFFRVKDTTVIPTNSSLVISSGSDSCTGPYVAYADYVKTIANGWGWAPDTNTTIHVIADGEGRTDTHVAILGAYGDSYCGLMPFTMPDSMCC